MSANQDLDYTYAVLSWNVNGTTYSDNEVIITVNLYTEPDEISAPEIILQESSYLNVEFDIRWTDVESALYYVLEESTDNITYAVIYNGTSRQYIISSENTGEYYFRVKAGNGIGESLYSGEAMIIIMAPRHIHITTDASAKNVVLGMEFSLELNTEVDYDDLIWIMNTDADFLGIQNNLISGTPLYEGIYYINITAELPENRAFINLTLTVTAPVNISAEVYIMTPENNSNVTGRYTKNVFCSDEDAIPVFLLNNIRILNNSVSMGQIWYGEFDSRNFTNGLYRLNVTFYRGSTPVGTAITEFYVYNPPSFVTVTITSPLNEQRVSGTITFSGNIQSAHDLEYTKYRIDSGEWINLDSSKKSWSQQVNTREISNGWHTLEVVSADIRGTVGTRSVNLNVQNTAPPQEVKTDRPIPYPGGGLVLVMFISLGAVSAFFRRDRIG